MKGKNTSLSFSKAGFFFFLMFFLRKIAGSYQRKERGDKNQNPLSNGRERERGFGPFGWTKYEMINENEEKGKERD